jgi:Rhomboid family
MYVLVVWIHVCVDWKTKTQKKQCRVLNTNPYQRSNEQRHSHKEKPTRSSTNPPTTSSQTNDQLIHLGMNMTCMTSFALSAYDTLGGAERFLSYYAAWAVLAGVATALVPSSLPALGASGAVCALLAFQTCSQPHSQLQLLFLPSVQFEARHGLLGLLCFDLCGLLFFRRRSPIAHAAHLGGVTAGVGTFALLDRLGSLRNWEGVGARHSAPFGLSAQTGTFRRGVLDGAHCEVCLRERGAMPSLLDARARRVAGSGSSEQQQQQLGVHDAETTGSSLRHSALTFADLRPVRETYYRGAMHDGRSQDDGGLLTTCDLSGHCTVFCGQFRAGLRQSGYLYEVDFLPPDQQPQQQGQLVATPHNESLRFVWY